MLFWAKNPVVGIGMKNNQNGKKYYQKQNSNPKDIKDKSAKQDNLKHKGESANNK